VPGERLAATRRGRGPRVVLVHGFTQTARSWDTIAGRLVDGGREVVAVDVPGHGDSSAVVADLPTAARLVLHTGGRAGYVGYSLGARICLHVALERPDDVTHLVLVSGSAGVEVVAERAQRRAADEALAGSIERDGVDRFLERWLAQPMFAGLGGDAAGVKDRRRNTAAGLASSLRHAGTGTQEPLWDRLADLAMPVLLVAGERDTKFVALAERMAVLIPDADLRVVPAAGHAVHLEQPDTFTAAVLRFMSPHPSHGADVVT